MQKHDLPPSLLSHSAGRVRNSWMGESLLAVEASWGNTHVVIVTLQAPEFAEQLQQPGQSVSCLMGGSRVTGVPTRLLRLCGCRRQVCPCVGEGPVRRMEEGSCHIGGCSV